jgi:RNA polymerase-binding protein DksA
MQPAETERFRQRLLHLRARLTGDIESHVESMQQIMRRPGETPTAPTHNADWDTERLEEEAILEQTQEGLLANTDAALKRIAAGTFGRCEDCGKSIAAERLDALPYTAYCIGCAQRHEDEGRKEEAEADESRDRD